MLPTRSRGELALAFSADGIARNYQAGCMRMRLPRTGVGERPTAILLNTSGGLADGDDIAQSIAWRPGSAVTVTTQAAEKVYRAMEAGASVTTRLNVGEEADAEWLPQETILFDRARLRRSTEVRLSGSARFLGIEAVIFGRAAMGERVVTGALSDRWRIWRDGKLVYADAFGVDGDVAATMARPALGGGAGSMAVVLLVASDAAAVLGPVRHALASANGQAAASSWNGILAVRLLAPDGATLRADLIRALSPLRDGRALPRVWSC